MNFKKTTKNNSSILIIFGLIICGFFPSCGSESDSGLKNALDNGHITTDINEADGFTSPEGTLMINDGEVATNKLDVILKLSGSDAVGITGYYLSTNSEIPSIRDSNWEIVTSSDSFSKELSDNISTVEQSYSFYAWYKDGAENISSQSSSSIIYDVTAPSSTSVNINSGSSTTQSTGVTLSLNAKDSVGVTGYYATESSSTPSLDSSGWKNITSTKTFNSSRSFSLSAEEGVKTVYTWFRDVAGNISTSSSDNITKTGADTTAPSGSITTTCGIELTAKDEIGVTGYYLSRYTTTPPAASSFTPVTSTTSLSIKITSFSSYQTYYVWYIDAKGNISSRYSASTGSSSSAYDRTAPSGSISLSESDNTTVTVSLSATDACEVSGYYLSESSSNPSSSSDWTTITDTKSYTNSFSYTFTSYSTSSTLYVWYKDASSNQSSSPESATHLLPLSINSTDPYTNSLSVTVTLANKDSNGVTGYYLSESSSTPPISASGWKVVTSTTSFSTSISYTFGSGEGTKTVYAWFRNSVGTVSQRYDDSIIYETVAPTGSVSINSGSSSTSIHLVTIALTSSDAYGVIGYYLSENNSTPSTSSSWVSVTSSTSYSSSVEFTLTTGNASKTVYAWFKDEAGNVSSQFNDSITLAFAGQISAGSNHTCKLDQSGSIKCWGKGGSYQLGNGSASSYNTAVSVNNISTAVDISLGDAHSCALLVTSSIKCWGSGSYGQMGDGSFTTSTNPYDVYSTGIKINSGENHVCLIKKDETVQCWGYNGYGQIGINGTTNQDRPQEVSGLSGVSQIALGSLHSCALLSSGGVKCWGYGGNGQLGNGSTSNSNTPVSVSGISTAKEIASGSSHTCARLSDGAMKCWGYGGNGQLGDNSLVNRSTPVSVSGISTAENIGGGDQHTCAVLSSGSVKCWGGNSYGQLGDSSSTTRKTPVSVTSLSNASKITLGESHTCSLNTDNSSKCWGRNNYAQLGNSSTTDSNTPVQTTY
jgi:alpha-tubulin suppressor-like RCC1 family protein